MGKLGYENQLSIRSTGRVIQALDNLVAALRASGKLRFRGRKVTKEAVVNAVWLWLEDMSPEDIEVILEPRMRRFEAMVNGTPEEKVGIDAEALLREVVATHETKTAADPVEESRPKVLGVTVKIKGKEVDPSILNPRRASTRKNRRSG